MLSRKEKLPGAVVIIGHEGKIAYRKAYGRRGRGSGTGSDDG